MPGDEVLEQHEQARAARAPVGAANLAEARQHRRHLHDAEPVSRFVPFSFSREA